MATQQRRINKGFHLWIITPVIQAEEKSQTII